MPIVVEMSLNAARALAFVEERARLRAMVEDLDKRLEDVGEPPCGLHEEVRPLDDIRDRHWGKAQNVVLENLLRNDTPDDE